MARKEKKNDKVPVKVNVLDYVNIDKDTIDATIKRMNDIYQQAKVKLVFDKDKDINQNVNDTGNNNGKIETEDKNTNEKLDDGEDIGIPGVPGTAKNGQLDSEAYELYGKGKKELEKHFNEKGKGIKIDIANLIYGNEDYGGLSFHSGDKNATPQPFIILRNSGTTARRGETLAHEVSHVLTVKDHSDDPNNLMFPNAEYTKDGVTKNRGTTLTPDQIKEIRKGAEKIGKTKKPGSVILVDTKHGSWTDDFRDVSQNHIDLFVGSLFAGGSMSDLEIEIGLGGMHPSGTSISSRFEMFFNTDNNVNTGLTLGSFDGIDKILQITLQGEYPFSFPHGSVSTNLYNVASGTLEPLNPGLVARVYGILDIIRQGPSKTFGFFDSIHQSLPLSLLEPLSDVVPIGLKATDFGTGEYDEASFQFDFNPPPGASIEMEPLNVNPGQMVTVRGMRFPPLNMVKLLIDNTEIIQTTTLEDGTFLTSFDVPNLRAGWYFVTAMSGNAFDFSILTVIQDVDLVVYSLTAPQFFACPSETITITDTTTNNGSGETRASKTIFYYSTDSVLDTSDTYVGERNVPALGPGESNAGTTSVTIASTAAQFTHYILAKGDAPNDIVETNEGNNARFTTIGASRLTLLSPNGDEVIPSDSTYNIRWCIRSGPVRFDLQYSMNNGTTWKPIANKVTGTSYNWQVPIPSNNKRKCLVKVIGYNASDMKVGEDTSDSTFTIEVVKVTSPDGGEILKSGETHIITWRTNATTDPVNRVYLSYTDNGGVTWRSITTLNSNIGSYPWSVPYVGTKKKKCKVEVILRDASGKIVGSNKSDSNFRIIP